VLEHVSEGNGSIRPRDSEDLIVDDIGNFSASASLPSDVVLLRL
jgi:hypothetical protein